MTIQQRLKQIAAAALAGLLALPALAQVRIGVLSSSTGPIALVGIPQKNSVALLPRTMGNLKVDYIALDDGGDPTRSVTEIKKLIAEHKVDAIIGPSGSPAAVSAIQFVAEAGVPLLAPVGTAAVVLPMNEQKKWIFKTTQNDDLIARALVAHMAAKKIRTVGFIASNDPYGENWSKVFAGLAAQANVRIVANERYQRTDTSVTAQALRIMAAKPDAVLVATPGGPAVLPQAALHDMGYKGQVYQTHGAALPAFLELGGKKVEGTILAASPMLVLNEIPDSNPSKAVAAGYVQAYEKLNGGKPATFGANVYDAGLLLAQAVPKAAQSAKPGTAEFRAALRNALEQSSNVVGTQGVYNMTAQDHSGFDDRGSVLIQVRNGNWTLVK